MDKILNEYKCDHIDSSDFMTIFTELVEKKYNIVSCYGNLVLNSGDTVIFVRDFISNITPHDKLFFIVDDKEFKITDSTRLFMFLSPLKPILLRNKNDHKIEITFKKWILNIAIKDLLYNKIIHEGYHVYFNGSINNLEDYLYD